MEYRTSLQVIGSTLLVLAAACDRGPAGPDPVASGASATAALGELALSGGLRAPDGFDAVASAVLTTGGRVSGHADIHGTPVQNVKTQTYSFTAMSTGAPPVARGQVQVHFLRFTGEEIAVHAEVTCLSVEGNQAWVGTRVRRFVIDGREVRLLRPMIFRVQDMGDGVADLASLVFFPAPGGDVAYCTRRPAFPILWPSADGNIQVNGRGVARETASAQAPSVGLDPR